MPRNWGPFLQRLRHRNNGHKAADDAQLKLYGQILPGGFLNYGYHEDTSLVAGKNESGRDSTGADPLRRTPG